MVLFIQILFQTFLKVFIVHGIILATFSIMAFLILKKDRKWINVIVSLFYINFVIGFLINMLYIFFTEDPYAILVLFMYYSILFFLLLGTQFLTLFALVLFKTEQNFTRNKQKILIIIFLVADVCTFLIPSGVTINATTNWNPVYNLGYFLYIMIVFTVLSVVPQIYCFFKIYGSFQQDYLKRRWFGFIIGIILLYILCYGTVVYNFLDIQEIRTIWALVSLFLSVGGAIAIYYGIVKTKK